MRDARNFKHFLSRICEDFAEFLPEYVFADFPGGVPGDFIDKLDSIGDPPFGDLAVEEIQQGVGFDFAAVLANHDQEWPFVPLFMARSNNGGIGNIRVRHGKVFEID